MEEGLFYSEAALLNRALFYSDYNDVNIFVEDEGKEYIYEDIFQRMFDYQIKNNTKGADVVLDLFGGSGTTLIACEQDGRKARLMELDPHYCDVILKRWENLTGKEATLCS